MPRLREQRTYRVRQLPQCLERQDVANFISRVSAEFGPKEDIEVFSLASSLIAWERPQTKVATIIFKNTPEAFNNDEGEWTVAAVHAGWSYELIFDTHFTGFTPLNDVEPSSHLADEYFCSHEISCIALSGLASHPFGSWKQRGLDASFMWLRDKLPEDVPAFRQVLYGYNTPLTGDESFQVIKDLALSLIERLRTIRSSPTAKHLIFFAHSLGGIILKQAMVILAGSNDIDKAILSKIRSVIFFAVPHLGMEMSYLLEIVKGQPNESLVRSLSCEGAYLTLLDDQLRGITLFSNIRIISAYETKLSRATQRSSEGSLSRTGHAHVAVKRLSAVYQSSERQFSIDKDHSNIVKFSRNDSDYDIVALWLNEIVESLSLPEKSFSSVHNSIEEQYLDVHFIVNDFNLDEAEQVLRKMKDWNETAKFQSQVNRAREEKISLLETKIYSVRETLRQSLFLPVLEHRFEKIETASPGTFDWIFEDPDLNFVSWLRNNTGAYWIRGKPGSGKSTLMKYLRTDSRTSDLLNTWKPINLQIDAWFFFDDRGSHKQKSLEGLLHAILHRVTSHNKRLADLILPLYRKKPVIRRNDWSLPDLQRALLLLLNQQELLVDLHVFLDALDEYGDPREIIAEFVADISANDPERFTKVKVCFSSRPWNVFLDRFNHFPGFDLHEHTRDDISHFARTMLLQTHLLTASQLDDKQFTAMSLLNDISQRAQGVFLWVKLVVIDLVEARHKGASLAKLHQLALEFPQELEDYYNRIIDRLPKSRRYRAFLMLEIVARSRLQLHLQTFVDVMSCVQYETSKECMEFLSHRPIFDDLPGKATRVLRDFTGGLLEVVHVAGQWFVQFMHQTVKDFISTTGFMHWLLGLQAIQVSENGHTFLAKYWIARTLAKTKSLVSPLDWNTESALLGCLHAHLSEVTTGISQRKFFDSLTDAAVEASFWKLLMVNSKLSLAVVADLRLYVRETLTRVNNVNKNPLISLLCCLANFITIRDTFSILAELDLTEMCRILLDFGANLESDSALKVRKSGPQPKTPFRVFFSRQSHLQAQGFSHTPEQRAFVNLLLEYGQNPNTLLSTSPRLSGHLAAVGIRTALHVSDALMCKLLLRYNANVNALDSDDRTPLDVAFCPSLRSRAPWTEPEKVAARISVLLEHGGRITKQGRQHLERCVAWLESNRDEIRVLETTEAGFIPEDVDMFLARLRQIPMLQIAREPHSMSVRMDLARNIPSRIPRRITASQEPSTKEIQRNLDDSDGPGRTRRLR